MLQFKLASLDVVVHCWQVILMP